MADLRLTHDPESGCGQCPLKAPAPFWCGPVARSYEQHWLRSTRAPEWCPLRTGTVTVSPPDREPSS